MTESHPTSLPFREKTAFVWEKNEFSNKPLESLGFKGKRLAWEVILGSWGPSWHQSETPKSLSVGSSMKNETLSVGKLLAIRE